ncbi:hypothetical protein TrRE_jg816, partial [Triparma retinervis]
HQNIKKSYVPPSVARFRLTAVLS